MEQLFLATNAAYWLYKALRINFKGDLDLCITSVLMSITFAVLAVNT